MNQKIPVLIAIIVLSALLHSFASAQTESPVPSSPEEWLRKNLDDKGVVQTKSGLQYKVLRSTQGCFPDTREPVTIHYEASRAEDNRVVDSSYPRGMPNTFSLSKMIKAWKQGIPMMREGEMWQFYAPPKLAYGSKGVKPLVGPDTVLIFRVELVKVGRCK